MPCKKSSKWHPTVGGCFREDAKNDSSHESTRQRVESSQPKNDENHIAGKGFTSMAIGESQEQEGGHSGSTKRQKKVHFATLMDPCHLKNAELEPKLQKYKGRVVLRGDIVKEDSGAYAVFTEQGSSAPQMTAAKVMEVTARLPDCDGQAADAVSAYTQVKMEDAPSFLKIPKSQYPDVLMRLPRHTWLKSWANIEDPVVPLERNFLGHP